MNIFDNSPRRQKPQLLLQCKRQECGKWGQFPYTTIKLKGGLWRSYVHCVCCGQQSIYNYPLWEGEGEGG